jgi:hypothetical protein
MSEFPLNNLTPLMRQYFEIKDERPDIILLMRVGDFFEAYGADAETVSRELEITLTGREDKMAGARLWERGLRLRCAIRSRTQSSQRALLSDG